MASISYSKLLEPVSDVISCMESMLSGASGPTTGDQRECYKRIHAYAWGLHTLVMDVITAVGIENAATRPAILERFNSLLNPIKTMLKNLDAGYDGDLCEEQSHIVAYVLATVAATERMVNNVWRFSQLKHGMIEPTITSVHCALLRRKFATALGQSALNGDLDETARVYGDESLLNYAIGELASNIVIHGNPERAIFLPKREGKRLRIIFGDGGDGFNYRGEDPFQPYWQSSEGNAGLGLGLYLARAYIEMCGGSISLTNTKKNITAVYVSLRLAE